MAYRGRSRICGLTDERVCFALRGTYLCLMIALRGIHVQPLTHPSHHRARLLIRAMSPQISQASAMSIALR
jgi:hypothetical protein